MGHLKEPLWIPLASFALAVLLSAAGASPDAGAVTIKTTENAGDFVGSDVKPKS